MTAKAPKRMPTTETETSLTSGERPTEWPITCGSIT